jgi:hypothetical protein
MASHRKVTRALAAKVLEGLAGSPDAGGQE